MSRQRRRPPRLEPVAIQQPVTIREAVQEEHARRERRRAVEVARRDVDGYEALLREAKSTHAVQQAIGSGLRARRHLISATVRAQLPDTPETEAFVGRLARALELAQVSYDALDVIARALEPPYEGDDADERSR